VGFGETGNGILRHNQETSHLPLVESTLRPPFFSPGTFSQSFLLSPYLVRKVTKIKKFNFTQTGTLT